MRNHSCSHQIFHLVELEMEHEHPPNNLLSHHQTYEKSIREKNKQKVIRLQSEQHDKFAFVREIQRKVYCQDRLIISCLSESYVRKPKEEKE